MASATDNIGRLSTLLKEVGAEPRVVPDRIVRSTFYDFDYHLALSSCAILMNGQEELDGNRSINAHWLKLLQFVAARPALVAPFGGWARARRHRDIDTWQQMPRGYLGDRTHDNTIELLVAGDMLRRADEELLGGGRFNFLVKIYNDVVERDLLRSERTALEELGAFRVNKALLRGQ